VQSLSDTVLAKPGVPITVPAVFSDLPGDLVVMCGRPAPCRPQLFQSDAPRYFPLTDDEKRALGSMYPSGWKPRI
jgi:hypothetical protein